jgi:hypothetical protein
MRFLRHFRQGGLAGGADKDAQIGQVHISKQDIKSEFKLLYAT